MQIALKQFSFNPWKIDWLIGPKTRHAIDEFKKTANITGEADIGPQTINKILENLYEREEDKTGNREKSGLLYEGNSDEEYTAPSSHVPTVENTKKDEKNKVKIEKENKKVPDKVDDWIKRETINDIEKNPKRTNTSIGYTFDINWEKYKFYSNGRAGIRNQEKKLFDILGKTEDIIKTIKTEMSSDIMNKFKYQAILNEINKVNVKEELSKKEAQDKYWITAEELWYLQENINPIGDEEKNPNIRVPINWSAGNQWELVNIRSLLVDNHFDKERYLKKSSMLIKNEAMKINISSKSYKMEDIFSEKETIDSSIKWLIEEQLWGKISFEKPEITNKNIILEIKGLEEKINIPTKNIKDSKWSLDEKKFKIEVKNKLKEIANKMN